MEYLTIKQVAEKLGLHRNTIGLMVADGRLRGERIGNIFLVPKDDLDSIVIIREEGSQKPIVFRRPDDAEAT
jgi:excisionase family DNA binding protein